MIKHVILATGLYVLLNGVTIAYYPLNVPHPLGPCAQERELSGWALRRLQDTPLADVPTMLSAANLGTPDPAHDWCAPRYQLRKELTEPAFTTAPMPRRAPLPPRRPMV